MQQNKWSLKSAVKENKNNYRQIKIKVEDNEWGYSVSLRYFYDNFLRTI